MKKFLAILLVLCIAIAFLGCVKPRPTTVVVQNSSDYQLSDIILFFYQGEDQVDQRNIGSLGIGSSSSTIEVSDKVEKVAVSFKFYIGGVYSVRYITVNKYLLNTHNETVVTIANDTYIKKYSNSKSPEIDNTDGTPVEIAAQ